MKVYKTVRGIQNHLNKLRKQGKKIGFTPTMGALHEGHLSLVKTSQEENDISVVSIFVNPTQFNNASDLEKYPRVVKNDAIQLKEIGLDVLFVPKVKQIYPNGSDYSIELNLGHLEQVMEGEFRPGHFEGMVQVVKRLLDIVESDNLYMGQKDFQQFTIVQHMIDYLSLPVKLNVVPIKREENGLAMSSRNRRLSRQQRNEATILYECLKKAKSLKSEKTPQEIINWAMRRFKRDNFKPEYFSIVDGYTLKAIQNFADHSYVVACTAVWVYGVRLIDNIIIKSPK